MDNGPVVSRIYDLIREEPPPGTDPVWRHFISAPSAMRQALAEFEGPLAELYDRHLADVVPSVECVEQFDRWMAQYWAEPDPVFVVRSVRGTG